MSTLEDLDLTQWDAYRPSHRTRWALDANRAILLSFKKGRIYSTDGRGAAIWQRLIAGHRWTEMVAAIPSLSPVDVAKFARSLLTAGLIERREASIRSSGQPPGESWWPATRPSRARCMLTMAVIKLSLRIRQFERTLEWAEGHRRRRGGGAREAVDLAVRYARLSAALLPGRHECLEQSLCLLIVLRRAGHDVQLRFAARGYPFMVHAWTELDGTILNDTADQVLGMLPLVEVS